MTIQPIQICWRFAVGVDFEVVNCISARFLNCLNHLSVPSSLLHLHGKPATRNGDGHNQQQQRAETELKPAAKS